MRTVRVDLEKLRELREKVIEDRRKNPNPNPTPIQDVTKLELGEKRYRLEKFDGQKEADDNKKPVEVIEFSEGADFVTVTLRSGKSVKLSVDEFNRVVKQNPEMMISDKQFQPLEEEIEDGIN